MTGINGTPLDAELIERTRFQQNPASCISQANVDALAALIRQTSGYRQALNKEQVVAIPEERTPVLKRLRAPAVSGWFVMELRWDADLYTPGKYSTIRAYLTDDGALLCVVNGRDRGVMFKRTYSVEDFAWLFMNAWICKDSATTYYDAVAMNDALRAVCDRVFEENIVQERFLADGSLCKELLRLLRENGQ